jgi:hypothetical protein
MKQAIKKLWERFVIHKYVSAGLQWGNATSFGYNENRKRLEYWENKYKELGYVPVSYTIWVSCSQYLLHLGVKE